VPWLEIYDENAARLTDTRAIQDLFEKGHAFESASAQALVVEALSYHYLLLQQALGAKITVPHRLTFGQVVGRLVDGHALHDTDLADALPRYVEMRNALVHKIVGSTGTINFQEFLDLGKAIITSMAPFLLSTVQRIVHPKPAST